MQKVAWPMTMVQKLNGMSSRPMAERSAMPVTMPGSAIGRTSSSEIASRPKKRGATRAAAASVPSTMRQQRSRPRRPAATAASACQMSSRSQATPNQLQGQPGRREDEALVLGGEGVEHDEGQRQVQEQHAAERGQLERQARAGRRAGRPRPQSASKAPSRLATSR